MNILKPRREKYHDACARISNRILSQWSFCLSVVSLIAIFLGWVAFGVSPLYTFQEIAYQQEQDNLKREFVQFHNELGIQFLYVEKIDAARCEFNQVLKVDPYNQDATKGLFECDVFSEANNISYDPEITYMQLNALKDENPEDPLPYLYLGNFALYSCNDADQALINYQKAIDLDDSVANAYAEMAYIYYLQNKTNESLEMYKKALNLSYWNVIYRTSIAYIYYERNEYQNAINYFNDVLILEPRYLLPYYDISNCYRLTGDLESALYYQEILIEHLNNNNITNLPINQGSFFLNAESREPVYFYNYPEKKFYAYYNIGLTYYLLGNKNKAVEYFNKTYELNLDEGLKLDMMRLINSDINKLEKEQPNLKDIVSDFRENMNVTQV